MYINKMINRQMIINFIDIVLPFHVDNITLSDNLNE